MTQKQIRVLLVEPMERPRVVMIDQTLTAMQELVGGYIEALPIYDDVSVVCNECGKLDGLQPNRGMFYDGELYDIICGAFFIAATPPDSDRFESLTDDQLRHYAAIYQQPEVFFRTATGIKAIKI